MTGDALNSGSEPNSGDLPPRPQEQLLIEALPSGTIRRVLCTSLGRAQFAAAAAQAYPDAQVECWFLDEYQAELARQHQGHRYGNLAITTAADMPAHEADLVGIAVSARGEAELTREVLQSGHQALVVGGRLLAATDNPADTWLDEQMRMLFGKVVRQPHAGGVLYSAIKDEKPRKQRNFSCEVVFRDREHLMRGFSRPGVFSHRHVDPGARRLMAAMEIEPGDRVFDIGCGWGAASLAAAARATDVQVYAIDSSARAIQCTERSAELNGWSDRITSRLTAEGQCDAPETYDLALANPPYYADFRIAALFLDAAHQALRPGGTVLVVTKFPDWYVDNMGQWFDEASGEMVKGYAVFRGIKAE